MTEETGVGRMGMGDGGAAGARTGEGKGASMRSQAGFSRVGGACRSHTERAAEGRKNRL